MTAGRPVLGILGGMGPAATVDLYAKVVRATPARRDQEHLTVCVWADPSVPDRTQALLGQGPDPTPALTRGLRRLEQMGASLVVVACNTAHAFLPAAAQGVGVRLLDMVEETSTEVAGRLGPGGVVGLLATSGTLAAGLYRDALARRGLRLLVPSPREQADEVQAAIAAVKAGDVAAAVPALLRAATRLRERGAAVVVAGCTEISAVLPPADDVVDPAAVVAQAAVRELWSAVR